MTALHYESNEVATLSAESELDDIEVGFRVALEMDLEWFPRVYSRQEDRQQSMALLINVRLFQSDRWAT